MELIYLPPYSPDLNPIEGFFAEPKSLINRSWGFYEEDPNHGLDAFLEWYIDTVGAKKSAPADIFDMQA